MPIIQTCRSLEISGIYVNFYRKQNSKNWTGWKLFYSWEKEYVSESHPFYYKWVVIFRLCQKGEAHILGKETTYLDYNQSYYNINVHYKKMIIKPTLSKPIDEKVQRKTQKLTAH